ncbi:MAG: hypothetical protein JWQ00_1525 [Noviherbaspirillum sp.]|nr:hypothetical protein [Noviherbaspirillum sp.]
MKPGHLFAAVPLIMTSACAFTPRTAADDPRVPPAANAGAPSAPGSGGSSAEGTSRSGPGSDLAPGGYRGLNPNIYFGY